MKELRIITIIIPTLNEESGIAKTIASLPKRIMADHGYKLQILVVDGNSTDSTREIALRMGAEVILENRPGYGRAYKTGLESARGETIVTLDADGTYPAEFIPEYVIKLIDENLDFVTVNRFTKIENGAMSLSHIIGNKILSFVMRLLYSFDVKDSQSGMWIMKKRFIDSINLKSDGMSLSEEIKIIAFTFFKSAEVDGRYYKRIGEAKLNTLKHGWRNITYLFHYRKHLKCAVKPPINCLATHQNSERSANK
jgi:glycosyltransferase involved in cell wall biosynthesis